MKASKFTDAPQAFIIMPGEEGPPVAEICRKAGISPVTDFKWKKYAGLIATERKRLKQREDQTSRLKKIGSLTGSLPAGSQPIGSPPATTSGSGMASLSCPASRSTPAR